MIEVDRKNLNYDNISRLRFSRDIL